MKLNLCNFLSVKRGSQDNEVLCKPDMTSLLFIRQGSDHDFLIVLHSKFLSEMRDLRDNEVLLQAGYDVIVISSLGGTSSDFS